MARIEFRRLARGLAIAGVIVLAAACKTDYPRGQFQGYVLGGTEEEIVAKVGKPAGVDKSNAEKPVLIYQDKTFDVENFNKVDLRTRVFLEKKDGKTVATEVVFG